MPRLLENCEELFGTTDLYQILGVDKTSTESQVKRGYYRQSLSFHPDRVQDVDKADATQKFQVLSQIYTLLSDSNRRALYDESGEVDDEIDVEQDRDWLAYWRLIYKELSVKDIKEFEEKYKGSDEELNDLKSAYMSCHGDMEMIINTVMCATFEDEDRFQTILKDCVVKKELPPFDEFTKDNKKTKKARKKKVSNMSSVFGIDFAPFKVPLHRRLETLAAVKFVFSFVIMGSLTCLLTLYVLLCTSYYWLALLYLCWQYYDWQTPSRGGRRAKWYRNWVLWRYLRDYFPVKLIKTHELDPQHNYVFAYHPHGIMGTGAFIHFGTEATGFSTLFPGITCYLLVMKILLNLPIVHDYYMLPGCCDVSRDSIEYLLEQNGKGNACIILVGGAKESLESKPGICLVLLKNRMGFCRMALKHGAHLVPVYSFGESDLYTQVDNPDGSKIRYIQNFMQKWMGFAIPFFHGRGIFNYNFGLLPHRRPINTVVGAPIPVKKIAEPTRDDLQNLHKIYCEKLKALFEEHKVNYDGYKDKELIYI